QHDDPKEGDVYVLCSDGLSGMVSDDDIRHIVTGTSDIREACRRLIQKANERGGEDNITAVLIKIEKQEETVDSKPEPTEEKKDPPEAAPEHAASNGTADKTGT
ncbi:MAG TPA: hypothetical protein VIF09_22295, partial [Polyangiaceae bacterium]